MSGRGKGRSARMSRRELIAGAAAAGGLAACASLTWIAESVSAAEPILVSLSDWSIDDMWGVYPRYAEPIDYVAAREPVAAAAARAGSIDALFHV